MNLAEIRKKARREKDAEPASPVETHSPSPSAVPPLVEATLEAPRLSEPDYPSVGESAIGGEEREAAEAPAEVASTFDPLAVILAGRLAAGKAAETEGIATESGEDTDDVLKYLRFRVADEDYGVSLLEIREIIKTRPVTEVPRMPGFVAGVISLRGTIIPVLDLRLRLGLAVVDASGRSRIIIAKRGEGMCGLLVDEVFQVLGLSGAEIEKAPPVLEGIDREFVRGIGRHGERMLIILDLEKVMDVSLR
ncbi:chemotaxis protein CheW [bacterium]|nr:chemotaxis protein CheW [bacterium]